MARPKTSIDWDTVNKLLEADCEGTEISAFLGIVPDTLYRRCQEDNGIGFADYLRLKKAKGNSLIKVKQFEAAVKDKDKAMLIWLGKNRLGQKDKHDVVTVATNMNIELADKERKEALDRVLKGLDEFNDYE